MYYKYLNYNAKDFAGDEFFWSWVVDADQESAAFWTEFLEKNPSKTKDIEEAKALVTRQNQQQYMLEKNRVERIWDEIKHSNPELNVAPAREAITIPRYRRSSQFSKWYWAAAIFIGFLAAVFTYLNFEPGELQAVDTRFGQTKEILLPDGSKVALNANSRIKYKSYWTSKEDRVIWLDGEAYFSVVHTENDQPFVVHSGDIAIEVLGTEFNVNNRRKKNQVVLTEGKVKVKLDPLAEQSKEIDLSPGDLLEINRAGKVKVEQVNAELFTSWKNRRLIFEDRSLTEVANYIEDNYGYKVIFSDTLLLSTQFTANIPSVELEILLNTLSVSYGLTYSVDQNKEITFKEKI